MDGRMKLGIRWDSLMPKHIRLMFIESDDKRTGMEFGGDEIEKEELIRILEAVLKDLKDGQ